MEFVINLIGEGKKKKRFLHRGFYSNYFKY